jgi:RNA polymerase sigma-70 factor (ECF subfamily)
MMPGVKSDMEAESENPDAQLVSDVLGNRPGAFNRLVVAYEGLVTHLVFRLIKNQHDREEVCQDVFMKVHGQLKSFRFQAKLSTWISRIAYNTALSHLKKRRLTISEMDDQLPDTHQGPAGEMSAVQVKELIQEKLQSLTVVEKSVLTFYHLEEMSVGEIGRIMDRPEGTIKSDLYRARRKMKDLLVREAVL